MQALKPDFARALAHIGQPHQSLSGLAPHEELASLEGFVGHMPSAAPATPVALPTDDLFRSPSSTSTTPLKRQSVNIFSTIAPGSKNSGSPSTPGASTSLTDQSLATSLPVLAKWLLVAAFYAGFNPVKSDVVHFVKLDDGIAKKGARARKAAVRVPGSPSKVRSISPLSHHGERLADTSSWISRASRRT